MLITNILGMLLISLLGAGCEWVVDFDDRLNSIVEPYRFSALRWELSQVLDKTEPLADGGEFGAGNKDEIELVLEYFSLSDKIRTLKAELNTIATGNSQEDLTSRRGELERLHQIKRALRNAVELIIGRQIRETLNSQGIFNPLDRYIRLKSGFPPINFTLDRPPNVLVVSPRDRIESMREIMLVQDIHLEAIEDIEAKVDALGVSALVSELGGFAATYPAFVADDASLQFTVRTAAEEWLHQYLAFTPLGFMYLLDATGIARNYDIATMNETLAGMVSDEIGEIVVRTYYPQYGTPENRAGSGETAFDFNREMRAIRIAVDRFLADGEIERAEKFMEERRQYLASQGYYIRKLNQAYFAFYGTYADEPTSVSPIGAEMKELRSQSASLREFLNTVAAMTSRQDLIDSLKKTRP